MPKTATRLDKTGTRTQTTRTRTATNHTEVSAKHRVRRTPYEMVQDLRHRRDEMEANFQSKVNKLDDRIQRLEQKHSNRIQISHLLETKTPEQLAEDLQTIQLQQKLLRQAVKRSTHS